MRVARRLDANLTERPVDPSALVSAIATAESNLANARKKVETCPDHSTTIAILARELTRTGTLLGLQRRLPIAEKLLLEAIGLWQSQNNTKALIMGHLKVSVVLRYDARLEAASAHIQTAIELAGCSPDLAVYVPFLMIERGLIHFNSGELNKALSDLKNAELNFSSKAARPPKALKHYIDTVSRASALSQKRTRDPESTT